MSFNKNTEKVRLEKRIISTETSSFGSEIEEWEYVSDIDILIYDNKKTLTDPYSDFRTQEVTLKGLIRGYSLPNEELRIYFSKGLFRVEDRQIIGNKTIVMLSEIPQMTTRPFID